MEHKNYYVCSYGGCGSSMLSEKLRKFGKVKHIHSRNPPDKLEYVGNEKGGKTYHEWFNGIPIPDNELKNYCVIYIYRNPSFSIPSRFSNPVHLQHIQSDETIKIKHVEDTGKDLYKISEFYDNYTKPNEKRNYKIYSIKYEELFDKQDELCELLGIESLNLNNISKRTNGNKKLNEVYSDLIEVMNKNDFISIC